MEDQCVESKSLKKWEIWHNESEPSNQHIKKPFLELPNINKKNIIFKLVFVQKILYLQKQRLIL